MLSTYVRKVPFLNKCCEKNGTRSVGTKTHAVTVLKTIKYEILYSLVRYTNFQSAFKVSEKIFFDHCTVFVSQNATRFRSRKQFVQR